MEGSSSGKNGSGNPDFEIFCYFGEPTPLRKSGTQKNPGRRFFICVKIELWFFFCWYESCILQGRADLGPTMVQTKKKKTVRTVEQCESSTFMTISEEMQRTTITMQMKIEAMRKEIDAVQMRMTNGGENEPELLLDCCFLCCCLRRNLAFKYKVDRNPKRRARSSIA
ncbi:hypothetical protein RHMOL_Rhmol09G0125500 [Rhododendron molle]|uniref:Uncharacterized protein n=1 Tax=Rhododendron molle TaxID=49168 RepID=A0ACC0MCU2_RHOML|nr:hypothetical protein RHMOL_Rhmol09G0125500 [Rhododendron molle]